MLKFYVTANAPSSMTFKFAGRETFFNPLHFSKAYLSIIVIESGMDIVSKL